MTNAIQPVARLAPSQADTALAELPLMITCLIGQQHYGLPIDAVREVVRLPALLGLAGAPPYLCGLLNLRGDYLPVLDGRILMDEAAHYSLSSQIIIIGYNTPEFGLLVDRVLDVYALQQSHWTPLNPQTSAAFLRGVINVSNRSVLLFDVAALRALVPDAT